MEYLLLEECCDILDSMRVPITASDRKTGLYPYYGANGIQDHVENYIFDDELVLLAEDGGNFGSKTKPIAYRVSGKCWVNNHAHVLKPKANIDVDYLCYSLMFYNTEELVNGATRQKLTQAAMRKMRIPQYTIQEQEIIVSKLSKVQAIISARQQQLKKLDELVKARFVELFGDYRINEKGFDCKKGSELFKFSSGKFLPEEKRLDEGVPVYGGNGIAWYTSECLVDYPTIIIGRVGAQCGNIHAVTTPVWITDNAIYIKEQRKKAYTLEFLTELMRMMDFYQYADFSGQPKITQKPLETLDYIMPPIELQNQFAAFVKQTEKSKVVVQKALDEAQTLFDSLMQKYFG